jgi:hypothetical protein
MIITPAWRTGPLAVPLSLAPLRAGGASGWRQAGRAEPVMLRRRALVPRAKLRLVRDPWPHGIIAENFPVLENFIVITRKIFRNQKILRDNWGNLGGKWDYSGMRS